MAGFMNKVILVGNLGRDPEEHTTAHSSTMATFRMCTTETWIEKRSGERMERSEWHNVVIFNEHLAKIALKYLKKGSKVLVEGSLATRKWQANDGSDRYTTEVLLKQYDGELILLGSKPRDDAAAADDRSPSRTRQQLVRDELDDDIPF